MQNPDAISLGFQVTISVVTITCEVLKGNKWPRVWLLALLSQALWFAWIVYAGNWGLLPLTLCLTWVFARNACKWQRAPVTDPMECCAEEGASLQFFTAYKRNGDVRLVCNQCSTHETCNAHEKCFNDPSRPRVFHHPV